MEVLSSDEGQSAMPQVGFFNDLSKESSQWPFYTLRPHPEIFLKRKRSRPQKSMRGTSRTMNVLTRARNRKSSSQRDSTRIRQDEGTARLAARMEPLLWKGITV